MSAKPSTAAVESCSLHLQRWRPFTNEPDPISSSNTTKSKRPCRSDRSTSFPFDLSKLTLFDEKPYPKKRRRRGSRSVSGVSSDRSGRRYCSVNGTCSDFLMPAAGTDSSGELFMNDASWSSDGNGNNEARARARGEKENVSPPSTFEAYDSGYGTEPGYRGDAEFADGDDRDEEDDFPNLLFWDHHLFGGNVANSNKASENTLQKTHHRCRRKKHDLRMVDPIG